MEKLTDQETFTIPDCIYFFLSSCTGGVLELVTIVLATGNIQEVTKQC